MVDVLRCGAMMLCLVLDDAIIVNVCYLPILEERQRPGVGDSDELKRSLANGDHNLVAS